MTQNSEQLHFVAVGAHIHDAEVMAGAILATYTNAGHRATIIHATPGEKGHPTMPYAEYERIKLDEARRSAAVLGADVIFMPYKDAELPLTEAVKWELADLFRELKPDIVFTHWRGSFHPDHYKTHLLTVEAATYAADATVKREHPAHSIRQMFYAENWEDMTDFRSDILVDVSASYNRWHNAMMEQGLFRGEVSAFAYKEYYEGLTAMRGALARCERAVALMTPRFASGQDPALLDACWTRR